MNNHNPQVNQNCTLIRWSPIIAGTLISLGTEVLLNFLGIGLGFSSFDMDVDRMSQIGTGAIVWLVLSGILSMFIGGFIVGRFSNIACIIKRSYHGFITWSISTLIVLLVTTTALGTVVGGTISVVKNSLPEKHMQQVDQTLQNNSNNSDSKADKTTDALGKASMSLFIGFLLSAFATAGGAIVGFKKEDYDSTLN